MASIGDTTRPEYIYDQATDTWIPVGIGPHSHTPAAIGAVSSSVVTTKGDLIVATGSGVVTRQGVGTDGQVLTANSAETDGITWATPVGSLANPIINGGMDIWQRGTSTSTSQAFAADRWQAYLGSGTATWSRQSVSDSTNLPNIQYCLRAQRNSGQTTTSIVYIWSNLETVNCIPFAGKTVTFSYYARAGANYSSASNALGVTIRRGTGTDQNAWLAGYTGNTETAATATLTTSWQRFVVNFTFPSNMTEFSPAFFYTPTGTAGANDYFEVTGVQVDVGTYTASTAPTFRRSGGTIAGELAACQRYFFKIGGEIANQMTLRQGGYFDANYISFYCPYPVPMRTAPSITAYGNPQVYQSGTAYTGFTWNNTIGGNPSTQNQYIVATKTSHGLTVNLSMVLDCVTTSDYIGVSAEL